MSTVEATQCLMCKHFRTHSIHCAAFPDGLGIPPEILGMEFDHRSPHPLDNGLRWEPKKKGMTNPFDDPEAYLKSIKD